MLKRISSTAKRDPANELDGVNVVGFLKTGIGLGEAARGYVSALKAAGVPVATRPVRVAIPADVEAFDIGDDKGVPIAPDEDRGLEGAEVLSPYSTNLLCVNADHMLLFYEEVGEAFFEDRRTIGVWGWETNSFPEKWLSSFGLVDELWVYSSYVARNLGRISPVPVVVIPPPVAVPDPGPNPGAVAAGLGIPEGFTFLFVFDFYSVSQRKNPLGLIEAFKQAFAHGEGPQLLLKSIHGSRLPEHLERLKFVARDHPDIHIVDRYVSLPEKTALMASCDCYVSLHRAEGLGLTLAEAMALGKPVIATGYSGNLDFMNSANSYLVDYTMAEIGEGIPAYSEGGGTWAEPDLEQAARLMRRVWENQEEARARGERASRDIEGMLSPEAVGQIARARLKRLAELPVSLKVPPMELPPVEIPPSEVPPVEVSPEEVPLADAESQLQVARDLLEHGPDVGGTSRLGFVGKFTRRLVLRVMRSLTFYQHHLDSALINALQETGRRVRRTERKTQRIEQRTQSNEHNVAALQETRPSIVEALQESKQNIEATYLNLVRRQVQIEKDARARDEALKRRIEELSGELRRLSAESSETESDLSEASGAPRTEPDAGYRS